MKEMGGNGGGSLADILNRDCHCIDVDRPALLERLSGHLADAGLGEAEVDLARYPFAASPVFVSAAHVDAMSAVIEAIEAAVRLPDVRSRLLEHAPASARQAFPTCGAFFSYDFHLGANGPQLIEVNTNAGGVLLNVYLAAAQKACCAEVGVFFGGPRDFAAAEHGIMAMFREEWRRQRGNDALRTIAIVDTRPREQPLYPEFLLFAALFRRHGVETVIAGPDELEIHDGKVVAGGHTIDLVYNRLTDFYLEADDSAILRDAYLGDRVVVTPAPRHYALYADKRNLSLLSDGPALCELGLDADHVAVLERYLPDVVAVTRDNAAELWTRRKTLFFKPASGFGSRGAYRGAKMTRRVWEDIQMGDYVAQVIAPPSERAIVVEGELRLLKVDIRAVTYCGAIQQLSARLYEGQATNLRTEGGGLATVFATPPERLPAGKSGQVAQSA